MDYLIIGGSGAAGQATIGAIREIDDKANILATTSGEGLVSGADRTIRNVDIREGLERVAFEVSPGSLHALFYTPAGGPVGYPVKQATASDIREATGFCVDPMVFLAEKLRPKLTVGYSAYYWLPHLLFGYGAMAYAKLAQERLAVNDPTRFKMFRLGTFESKSKRGVFLLFQRIVRKPEEEAIRRLFEDWKSSGRKFGDFFMDFVRKSEEAAFGPRFSTPYRLSDSETIRRGIVRILEGESAPILNGIGDWFWTDEELPELPEDFRE